MISARPAIFVHRFKQSNTVWKRAVLRKYLLSNSCSFKCNCSQTSLETANRGLFSADSPIFTMASSNEFGMVSRIAMMVQAAADAPFRSPSRFPRQLRCESILLERRFGADRRPTVDRNGSKGWIRGS